MKKLKKIGISFIFLFAFILAVSNADTMQAAATGYTDHKHTWETPSKCGTCGGDHLVTCPTCDGLGNTYSHTTTGGNCYVYGCKTCGGGGSQTFKATAFKPNGKECLKSGDNHTYVSSSNHTNGSGTVACSKCYASGTYKGKNTRCTYAGTSGCGKGSYAAWSDYPNGVCYTTANTYTVVYKGNGNTGGSTANSSHTYGTAKALTANGFTKTGYTFLGWSTLSTATTPTYTNGQSVSNLTATNGGTVILYAVWKPKSHTVAYDANGGSGAPEKQTVTYGTDAYVSETEPTRTGYTFKYWTSTTADLMKQEIPISNNAYVEKAWIENYWENGVFYCKIFVKAPSGLYIKLPTWTYDASASDTGQDDIGSWTANNIMTSGSWERGGDTYNYSWAFPISARKYELGETITQIYIYTSSNAAWNANVGYASLPRYGYQFNPGDLYPSIQEDTTQTLYAQWQANKYTVTLNVNGGTCVNGSGEKVESVTTTYDTDMYYCINGFLPTRTGYTFKGWYDALEGGTQVYGPDGFCTNEGTYWKDNKWSYADDVTLYAQWEQNEYTVTYDANGGSTPTATQTYHYNDEVVLSLSAEKDGKIFVGWNTEPNAKTALNTFVMPDLATTDEDDNKDTVDIIEDDWELTLYAIYTIQVSDVANHTYPDYEKVKEQEVFLRIWESGNDSNCKDYSLSYEYDANKMVYRYIADVDTTDFVKDMSAYCYAVYAYDNAGNWKVLATDTGVSPPAPAQECTQTVNHYRYDAILQNWVKFDTTKEEVEKGKTFAPSFITSPTGYQADSITYPEGYTISNGTYVVSEPATSSAYYKPMDYTLSFDVNASDASVTPTQKTVTYGGRYGELPTPVRKGYSFIGWYTEVEGGMLITSSMKYEMPGDSTVYAHWERNSYEVIYDYWTNGGTYASVLSKNTPYGSAVDLSVTATKNGYTFVGWNTNPDATSNLSSIVMEDKELVLYAIYKKDITATFIDSDNGIKRTVTSTVYNNQTEGSIDIPSQNAINGWLSLGWSLSSDAQALIVATPGTNYLLSEDTTFYGCYVKEITLSYDTNGSGQSFDAETKERYYNAYGNYSNPIFTITAAPTLSEHSFVAWVDKVTGDEYQPGDNETITVDTLLTARWDAFPEIEAYDRYFTLEEAQNGEITPDRLLEKVTGTDKEDGALINGEDVIVLDYNASDFLYSTEVEVTYQATDSFGNTVEKTVTVHVVDTTVKKSPRVRYIRFISSRFYADETGSLLAPEKGGLELTSIWRNNDSYKSVLERVLYNKKLNEEYKTIEYFGTSTEVKIAGSGEWQTEKSTWVFTKDDIEEVKSFVDTHGYGNIREPNALELFIEAFRKCLKLN